MKITKRVKRPSNRPILVVFVKLDGVVEAHLEEN